MLPFNVDIRKRTEPVKGLASKLVSERGPGILRWMVQGFIDWQSEGGLVEPQSVREAVAQFRLETDDLTQFLNSECRVDPSGLVGADEMQKRYKAFGGTLNRNNFARAMEDRYERKKFEAAISI